MNESDSHEITQIQQGDPIHAASSGYEEQPEWIGRYRVESVLGAGSFGVVYLAMDEQLSRPVALKVPHARLISRPEDAEAYLAEARAVASLDHPGIVPVYDVGSTDEFPCYIVSKYIPGTDLAAKLRQGQLSYREAGELVATVADALQCAHRQGLVHRDVKPGNILFGSDGRPYVVDFGLALREENIGKGPKCAGTPAYMSPEQARGEGHRVDGRSDIFSLGVVFFELLTGGKPFRGDSQSELLQQVVSCDPRPLLRHHDELPKELQRICLKALSKRSSERYSTAHEMAEDIRYFLNEQTIAGSQILRDGMTTVTSETSVMRPTSASSGSKSSFSIGLASSDHQPVRIVPKGLRSFDSHDSSFFLELLPGPRDRDGLPDSLRFWKTRIEELDSDNTFAVGLIYGPSGCGKSSLVKAGLLPRLSEDVIAVYIEATPSETEPRILHGLRKRCPALEDQLSLKETLAALRRGQGVPVGKKVLIVLDQFEQWLHANKEQQDTELVQALRQCDGERVQCIVMVRDDFWLAVSRFLRDLEIRLVEGQNSALVDLFDMNHAWKVLAAFGRAFGQLPENPLDTGREQKEFLKQAVAGLAKEGKVICVRLSLFAEMMKSKAWTPASLKAVGGTEGVGVTFLEETFSAESAPPEHRFHQKAARGVLKALLPESGTDIKGHMRSYAVLLDSSGYDSRPKDFDGLIAILDSEIRLITPTDPEGADRSDDSSSQAAGGQKYYQLAHDYLVHSLRDWLTRKQKETRRGRAELRLIDRTVSWNSRPENRFLPSWLENLRIRFFTDRKTWTDPQRKMMSKAGQVHGIRTSLAALLLVGMTFAGFSVRRAVLEQNSRTQAQILENGNRMRAEGLVDSLLSADIAQVPAIISDLKTFRQWGDPILRNKLDDATDGSVAKLHLALALLPVDKSQVDYLSRQLPVCTLSQFQLLRETLPAHKSGFIDGLWLVVQNESQAPSQRLQAAAAVADYAPEDDRWKQMAPFVAQHLTNAIPAEDVAQWRQLFQPASTALIDPLTGIHADRSRSGKQREKAAFLLAGYLKDQPDKIADVIVVADEPAEFSVLIEALRPFASDIKPNLLLKLHAVMPEELIGINAQLSESEQQLRDAHWKRQALAAVTLVQLGFEDEIWPLLKLNPDPSLRSFVIIHLGKLGTDHNLLFRNLQVEKDVSIRRALIQSLGGLDAESILPTDRSRIVKGLQSLYVENDDPGIHGSASWALQHWGATLPELSVGEPELTSEQQQQTVRLTTDLTEIRQRLVISEQEFSMRQATWEQQLLERPAGLPASLSNGLAAHYPFDEGTGTATANAVEGQPGAVYEGEGQPQWVAGVTGSALRFDGNGQFAASGILELDGSEAISIGCWFICDGSDGVVLVSTEDPENAYRGFELGIYRGELETLFSGGTTGGSGWGAPRMKVTVATPAGFPQPYWQHYFVTFDSSGKAQGISIYLNGERQIPTIQSNDYQGPFASAQPVVIGGRAPGQFRFQGCVDDVRVYNRCLDEGEILALFKSSQQALANIPRDTRTPEQQGCLAASYLRQDELTRLEHDLADANGRLCDARIHGRRCWYVNTQGQTMVLVRKPPTTASSPQDYVFAISNHETTVAEFRQFQNNFKRNKDSTPAENCPADTVNWYEAAAYCNWLSQLEGIPEDHWIYVPNENGQYAEGMSIKATALELNGYRLPNNEEWSLACRAATGGTFSFGESVPILGAYGLYGASSSGRIHPVQSRLPNDDGLFDMHGNLWEWTQNPNSDPASLVIRNQTVTELAGGSFLTLPWALGSASRCTNQPHADGFDYGFRLVRTLPLSLQSLLPSVAEASPAKQLP